MSFSSEYEHLVTIIPGDVVNASVTEIQDGRLICTLPGDVAGIINNLSEGEWPPQPCNFYIGYIF